MKYFVEIGGKQREVDIQETFVNGTGLKSFKVSVDGEVVETEVINGKDRANFALHLNHHPFTITIEKGDDGVEELMVNGDNFTTRTITEREYSIQKMMGAKASRKANVGEIKAPMPGLIVKLDVEKGQQVKKGDGVLVLEAMKMENEIKSPINGIVSSCKVNSGDAVVKNQLLLVIEAIA